VRWGRGSVTIVVLDLGWGLVVRGRGASGAVFAMSGGREQRSILKYFNHHRLNRTIITCERDGGRLQGGRGVGDQCLKAVRCGGRWAVLLATYVPADDGKEFAWCWFCGVCVRDGGRGGEGGGGTRNEKRKGKRVEKRNNGRGEHCRMEQEKDQDPHI